MPQPSASNILLNFEGTFVNPENQPLAAKKASRLQERVAQKESKLSPQLDVLGTYRRDEFNDADTTGFADNGKPMIRLGTPTNSLSSQWIDTPESPWTATNRGIYNPTTGHKEKRPLTQQELANYNASKMALDNFAMGTTPASKESFDDIRNNPLTPENQKLYNDAIAKLEKDKAFNNLTSVGIKGKMDNRGKRQIGDFVNTGYNPNETLSSRLVNSGNAAVHGTVSPVSGGLTVAEKSARYEAERRKEQEGFVNSLLRGPKAAMAGLLKSGYDAADTAVELGGDVAGRAVGLVNPELGKTIDKKVDLATGDQKTQQINDMLGYDDKFNAEVLQQSGKHYDKAVKDAYLMDPSTWGNVDMGELWKSAKTAFSTPESAMYSVGYIVPALYGAAEKGVVKLFGGALAKHEAKVTAIKAMNKSNAFKKKAIKAAERSLKGSDKVKLFVAKNADAALYGATMNNDQMDDWVKANGGEDPSLLRMGLGFVGNTLGMKLDMGSAKFAIKGSHDLVEPFVQMLKGVDSGIARKTGAKVAEYGARMAAAGVAEELPQEFIQSYIEAYNKVYGTDGRSALEVAADPKIRTEAAHGAIAGLAGGAHMAGGAQVYQDTVGNVVKGAKALGNTDVAQGAKNIAQGAKGIAKDGVTAAKGVFNSDTVNAVNNINEAEVNQDYLDETTDEPAPVPSREEHVAAVSDFNDKNKVADEGMVDAVESDTTGNKAKFLQEASADFDDKYQEVVDGTKVGTANVQKANDAGDTTDYTPQLQTTLTQAVNQLTGIRDEIANVAGEDSAKVELIDKKIKMLVPLVTASSPKQMHAIVSAPEVTTSDKVAAVLGSSAASIEDINTVLGSADITPAQKQVLETKLKALTTYSGVQKQKLIGGGVLPGAMQWLGQLVPGASNTVAMKKINNFVDGQRAKLGKFKKALSTWDKDNGMPWVGMSEVDAEKEYPVSGSSLKSRTTQRLNYIREHGDKLPLEVRHGDKTYRKVAGVSDLIEKMETEQQGLDGLLQYANEVSSSQQPSKVPTEAKEVVGDKEAKVSTKKPSGGSNEANLPSVDEVVNKIVNGEKLTDADLQVQDNNGKAIEAKLQEIANTSQKAPTKPSEPQTKEQGTTSPKTDNEGPKEAESKIPAPNKNDSTADIAEQPASKQPKPSTEEAKAIKDDIIPDKQLEEDRVALEMLMANDSYEVSVEETTKNLDKAVADNATALTASQKAIDAKLAKIRKDAPALNSEIDKIEECKVKAGK